MPSSQEERLLGWADWPTTVPRSAYRHHEVYDYQKQLEQKSDALFTVEPSKVKLEVIVPEAGMSSRWMVSLKPR